MQESSTDTGELDPRNPMALFEERSFAGPPRTRWERLQRFSHNNKGKIYFLMLVSMIFSISMMMKNTNPASLSAYLGDYFERMDGTSRRAYAVDGIPVTQSRIAALALAVERHAGTERTPMRPHGIDDAFVRDQFETDVLVRAAIHEGILDSADARLVIENAVRHVVADYYVHTRLDARLRTQSDTSVSREETVILYEKERGRYQAAGFTREEALALIARTLTQIKRGQAESQVSRARREILSRLVHGSGTTPPVPSKDAEAHR